MTLVSERPHPCGAFLECAALLDGEDIQVFDGLSLHDRLAAILRQPRVWLNSLGLASGGRDRQAKERQNSQGHFFPHSV